MSLKIGLLMPTVLIGLIAQGFGLAPNDPCTNPKGDAGRCIFFRECEPLVAIHRQTVITPAESEFIQKSRCGVAGGKALVCCATLPRPPYCGNDMTDRIVKGQPTTLEEFPWTALIKYRKPRKAPDGFHCGGSLINSRFVLTAAHCIEEIPRGWEVIGIRLGEWNLSNEIDCIRNDCNDAPVDVDIEEIIVHEDYNPQITNQLYDIALIRMVRDVSFSAFIDPICLPIDQAERSLNIAGMKVEAAGWGRTENGTTSDVKLKVELNVTDFKKCAAIYKRIRVTLRDTQLCAAGMQGGDTCSGDSGGPLMKLIQTNYFLYGIVSFGPNKCGTKDVPGVYTSVPKYMDWIESNVQ